MWEQFVLVSRDTGEEFVTCDRGEANSLILGGGYYEKDDEAAPAPAPSRAPQPAPAPALRQVQPQAKDETANDPDLPTRDK